MPWKRRQLASLPGGGALDKRDFAGTGRGMGADRFFQRTRIYYFVLSVLVVFIHAVNLAESNDLLYGMAAGEGSPSFAVRAENLFSNGLGQMAVPGFFLMSGYLFFRGLSHFSGIFPKWKRRVFSLLLPYLVWNLFYYLLHLLSHKAPFTPRALLEAVFLYRYNPVFWYLYQLLWITLLAPLLYLFTRHAPLSAIGSGLLLFSMYSGKDLLPFVNEDALFYYFLGVLFAYRGRELFEGAGGAGQQRAALLCALCFLFAAFFGKRLSWDRADARAFVLFTVLLRAAMALSLWFLLSFVCPAAAPRGSIWRLSRRFHGLLEMPFFLYATHYMVVRGVSGLLEHLPAGMGQREGILLFVYFLMPPLCIGAAYGLSLFLRRFCPAAWKLLAGNR